MESTYLNRDMCKFESWQKDESRWQSTDSSKAYRNISAFKCYEKRCAFYGKDKVNFMIMKEDLHFVKAVSVGKA